MDHSMLHIMTVGEQLDRAGLTYMFHNDKQMTVSFKSPEGCKVSNTFVFNKPVWKENEGNDLDFKVNNDVIIPGLVKGFRTLADDNFSEKPNTSETEREDHNCELRKYRNIANLLDTLEDRNNLVRSAVNSYRIEIYSSFPDSVMVHDSVRSLLETRWDDNYSLLDETDKILRKNLTDMEDTIHKNIHFPEGSLVMFDFAEGEPGARLLHEQSDISIITESLHRLSETEDPFTEIESAYSGESLGRGHMAVYIDAETFDLKIDTDEPMPSGRNHTYVLRNMNSDFSEKFNNGDALNGSEVAELMENSMPIGEEIAEAFGFGFQKVLIFGLAADDPNEKMFFPLSMAEKIEKSKDAIAARSDIKPRFAEVDVFDKSKVNPDLSDFS